LPPSTTASNDETGCVASSSLAFNLADLVSQWVVPPLVSLWTGQHFDWDSMFEDETIVSKMINPEDNDLASMAVGSLAPCVSAPWWEEVGRARR